VGAQRVRNVAGADAAFFTTDLQARIPDDFMPAQAVRNLNAQSPDGRRPTLQNMGLLRRMSHAATTDGASDTDRGARRPSEPPSPPSVTDGGGAFTTSSASILRGSDPTEPTASAAIMRPGAAAGVAGPCNIEVGPPVSLAEIASGSYRDDPPVKPHDWPDVPDEDESLTLPEDVPE
jgi:hypothetical protein